MMTMGKGIGTASDRDTTEAWSVFSLAFVSVFSEASRAIVQMSGQCIDNRKIN